MQRLRLRTLSVLLALLLVTVVLTGCCCCTSPGYRRFRPRPLFRDWSTLRLPRIRAPWIVVPAPGALPLPLPQIAT